MVESNEYPCHGFHERLDKGKSSGTLRINASQVVFNIKGQNIIFSLSGLQIKVGGASNRLVFFHHQSHPDWSFYTSDRSVLNHSLLTSHPTVAGLVSQAKLTRASGWFVAAAIAVVIIAIPLLIVFNMDRMSAVAAKKVPAEWEQKLGASTLAQYRISKEFIDDKKAKELLSPLTQPLINALENSRYTYNFHIVNDASLNAFALPGGEVVIHSALILKAESAEELLGVLGHEIIHVEEQHGVRNVIGSAGIYVIAGAIFGDVSGILAVIGGAAPLLLNQSYSRGFETESDIKGFALLQRANINPRGLATFFNKLIEEEKKMLEKIEDEGTRDILEGVLGFMSTHPASEERIKKLNTLEQSPPNQQYMDFTAEFALLQEYVKGFVIENNPDEDVINEKSN